MAPVRGFEPPTYRLGALTIPLQGVRPVHIIYILAVFRRMVRSLAVDFAFFAVFVIARYTTAPNRVPKMVPCKDKLQKYPLQITKAFKFELTIS